MKGFRIPYWPLAIGPYLLFAAGFAMNAIVCGLNHSTMPVLAGYAPANMIGGPNDAVHSVMTSASHLKFLADWIVINGIGIASPGDFLEMAFSVTYIPALIVWVTLMIRDANVKS